MDGNEKILLDASWFSSKSEVNDVIRSWETGLKLNIHPESHSEAIASSVLEMIGITPDKDRLETMMFAVGRPIVEHLIERELKKNKGDTDAKTEDLD